jgi:hypothetical protein
MSIYRAEEGVEKDSLKRIKDRDTRRPPGNVSYVVDNLWEWVRSEEWPDYPNRRNSKFASPTPEQALRSADLPEDSYEHVFEIEFVGCPVIAQLPEFVDAKHHPDCRKLRKLLIDKLDGENHKFFWPSKKMEEKHPVGQLFQPCLTSEEVEHIFNTVDEFSSQDKNEIREKVTYWDDLELIDPDSLYNQEGEVLFQFKDPKDGDGFWRRPIEEAD